MASLKLTKRSVDALRVSPNCDYFVWDVTLKGFGVRVTQRDAQVRKTFVVGYRPRGSRVFRRLTLGAYGPMTVDSARREALRNLASVSSGEDPLASKQATLKEATLREIGAAYLADVHVRRKTRTAAEYSRLWVKHVLPALGTRKVGKVTTADVRKLHRSMHRTPYLANRTLAMLGAFFSFAAGEGARPTHDNPARGVDFYQEHARERFLTPAEFKRLGDALTKAEREGLSPAPQHRRTPKRTETARHRNHNWDVPKPANPLGITALRLLALTGCRESEILSLRWDAVDLERGYLRLAETKTGKSIRPLGAAAAALLTALPRVEGSSYVFPGAKAGDHLKEIKRVWFAVRHAAGLDGLRLHDLRHSFASVPAIGGDSILIIRSLMGHARIDTTMRYAHLGDDPAKRAADRTAGDIEAWMNGHETAVMPLHRVP